jgi:hypothetical protein
VVERLSVSLKCFSGARAFRLSDNGTATVPEHAHDWPVLSLFVTGSYRNLSDLGVTVVSQPSAMFYRPGERHSNVVGPLGLEQIDLEFDPAWLGLTLNASWCPVVNWKGGSAGLLARRLARLWREPQAREAEHSEQAVRRAAGGRSQQQGAERPDGGGLDIAVLAILIDSSVRLTPV